MTDTDDADILIQVAEEIRGQVAQLALARVQPPVLALWRSAVVLEVVGEDGVFENVHVGGAAR